MDSVPFPSVGPPRAGGYYLLVTADFGAGPSYLISQPATELWSVLALAFGGLVPMDIWNPTHQVSVDEGFKL